MVIDDRKLVGNPFREQAALVLVPRFGVDFFVRLLSRKAQLVFQGAKKTCLEHGHFRLRSASLLRKLRDSSLAEGRLGVLQFDPVEALVHLFQALLGLLDVVVQVGDELVVLLLPQKPALRQRLDPVLVERVRGHHEVVRVLLHRLLQLLKYRHVRPLNEELGRLAVVDVVLVEVGALLSADGVLLEVLGLVVLLVVEVLQPLFEGLQQLIVGFVEFVVHVEVLELVGVVFAVQGEALVCCLDGGFVLTLVKPRLQNVV